MDFFDFLNYAFVQRAYIAGSFIAALCAVLGVFLVLRKLSLIGDGLAHVSFGAIALGLFIGAYPFYVVVPIAILAAYFILKLTNGSKIYGDAAVGIVSSVGIASGVILAGLSNGFNVNLFSYLFGNILAISIQETALSVILSLVVFIVIIFFYNDFFSATFDEEYARISGVNVDVINIILAFLTAISVVLAIKVVGVMLVSALLILPAVSSLRMSKGFGNVMVVAALIAVFSVLTGVTVSFYFDISAGATIVMVNFMIFCASELYKIFK